LNCGVGLNAPRHFFMMPGLWCPRMRPQTTHRLPHRTQTSFHLPVPPQSTACPASSGRRQLVPSLARLHAEPTSSERVVESNFHLIGEFTRCRPVGLQSTALVMWGKPGPVIRVCEAIIVPLSKHTGGGYGRRRISPRVPPFSSPCRTEILDPLPLLAAAARAR
jgi:hypothetical protein